MGVRVESTGRRFVEMTVTIPGTVEDAWFATATGPGISTWFVPTELDERKGGALTFHLDADLDSPGQVTVWEPPQRLCYVEAGWMEGAPDLETEILITPAGEMATVRMTHCLQTDRPDWDIQLEGMEKGWPPFFRVLQRYMRSYRGLRCASIRLMGGANQTVDDAWQSFLAALGVHISGGMPVLADDLGDSPLRLLTLGPELEARALELLLPVEGPASGTAMYSAGEWGGQVFIAVQLYFYGTGLEATVAALRTAWRDWLEEKFPVRSA